MLGGIKVGSNLTISNGVLSAVQGKVDLSPYAKTTDIASTYAKTADLSPYAKTADIASTYAKKTDISTAFRYRGSVDTYSALPTNGVAVGDVYNVVAADTANNKNPVTSGGVYYALGPSLFLEDQDSGEWVGTPIRSKSGIVLSDTEPADHDVIWLKEV